MKKQIIKNQELFFDLHAEKGTVELKRDLFFLYAIKETNICFDWISDKKILLDYGCGNGLSLDMFFFNRNRKDYQCCGVDISANSINVAKGKYPEYTFYKISNNKIPEIPGNAIQGAFLSHILHHSHEREAIFEEIYSKLAPSGKFFLIDLSSRNPLLKTGRFIFQLLPMSIKNKFSNDLVVNGRIPEKLDVNIDDTVAALNKLGFKIVNIGYGHLFFFIFDWFEKFWPFSEVSWIAFFYKKIMKFEQYLLKFSFFKRKAELFYIQCEK